MSLLNVHKLPLINLEVDLFFLEPLIHNERVCTNTTNPEPHEQMWDTLIVL